MLSCFLQPLSARKDWAHLKEETDDVPKIKGGLYLTFYCPHGNIHKIINLWELFLLLGIYIKVTDIWEQFSYKLCKHILTKEGGKGQEVWGVGKYFFPTSPALECSPVIARSTHTGLFIPVQSPLNYILKGLKQHFASSNHHPKCSRRSWQYRQHSCTPFFKALLMSPHPLPTLLREGEPHLQGKALLKSEREKWGAMTWAENSNLERR